MTKKIFHSIFLVVLAVLLASFLIISYVLYGNFTYVQESHLKAQAALAAQGVDNEGAGYFQGLDTSGYRLTWVSSDGTVLYDSSADAKTMGNHLDREEIREALENGAGESERYSSTLAERTLYRAQRLSDGTVVRVSVTQDSVLALLLGMLNPMLFVLLGAVVISILLARRLSRRIVAPLNEMDLEQPLENNAYEELSPLLTRIERQHRQIKSQLEELSRRQDEFSAVTGSMSEGLILLNEHSAILSINPAAARLFGVDAGCVGRDMLIVDRSLAMQELVKAAQAGKHDETVVNLRGREYQINASPVLSGGSVAGVVLLTFDVTEKALAEKQRREFTANVSHELKTPLQSILGSAELIENGLVKSADMPRFVGHIRSEASRLMALISDIIRLSQLDEGVSLPMEDADLKALAVDVAEALSEQVKARGVTLEIHGESAPVRGVKRLLWEIVYNLCLNAIQYNRENGRVDVTIAREASCVALTVADTGIGISPQHQSRVFERFYRVDKSHSKETGGTGLGLSIVKHAAQYHNATIDLQSAPGKGTSITVRFPQK